MNRVIGQQGVVMPHSYLKGGSAMNTYEALSLMVLFSMLIIAVLGFKAKK
ncbi:MAG: putative holin-like toxin [Clostridia bacterium]